MVLKWLLMTVLVFGSACSASGQKTEFVQAEDGTWVVASEPEAGTDEAVIAEARQLLAQDKPAAAERVIDRWIAAHEGGDNRWMAQALLLRGDTKTALGHEHNALFDYEEVILSYPASEEFVKAIEREFDIGVRYLRGMRRKLFGLRISKAESEGVELLVRVSERLIGSKLAEKAHLELAEYYYRTQDLKSAALMYELIVQNFPESEHRAEAMIRRIDANIAMFKGPRYDGSGLLEARFLIADFVARYPAEAQRAGVGDALNAWVDERQGEQMLDTAMWYLKRGDPTSARFVLRRLQRKHPQSIAAGRAIQIMVDRGWLTTKIDQVVTDDSFVTDPIGPEPVEVDEAVGAEGANGEEDGS